MSLKNTQKVLEDLEKYGVRSVARAKMFLKFAANEGKSMGEIAGSGAQTPPYIEVHQALMALGDGYPHGSGNGPKLVTLKARKGHGIIRDVKLTARGKRLYERLNK